MKVVQFDGQFCTILLSSEVWKFMFIEGFKSTSPHPHHMCTGNLVTTNKTGNVYIM